VTAEGEEVVAPAHRGDAPNGEVVEVEKLRTGQVGNGDQEIPRDVSQ